MEEYLKELLKVNKEILMWQKLANINKVKNILENTLDTSNKIHAYHQSDGKKNRTQVANLSKTGASTISDWWQSWIRLGIAEPVNVQRGVRGKKNFELSDFGIILPNLEVIE